MKMIIKFAVGSLLVLYFLFGASLIASADVPGASPTNDEKAELIQHASTMEANYDLPPGLLVSICEHESRWRNVAGRAGEIGVCQIKPETVFHICPECANQVKYENFRYGSKGASVARIQAVLAKHGLYHGVIDGIFGSKTRKAVVNFQQISGIAVDGIVGAHTWKNLFGEIDPFPGETLVDTLWKPKANIEWAARYLSWLRDNYSQKPLLLMAMYNGGPGNMVVRYMLSVDQRRFRIAKQ